MNIKATIRYALILCLLPLLFPGTGQAQAMSGPFPERTQRILFLGNSITYAGNFINDVETYFLIRYPERRYEWVNAGLPSETVSGLSEVGHAGGAFPKPWLHERLERVLEAVRPDVVFACYGMNDGIKMPLAEERFAPYRAGMERLDLVLKQAGVREIVYLTPPVHDDKELGLEGYNRVLDAYSEWLLGQRERAGWRVIDLHFPMKEYLREQRLTDPDFKLARDGVHPQESGHWLMARQILSGLGETRVDGAPDLMTAVADHPQAAAIRELVARRQAVMKDAWLTLTGHLRPRMKTGLPMPEARQRYEEAEAAIRELLENRDGVPQADWVVMDMVHHNPGEPFTHSVFNDPATLAGYGFHAQVINEFQSVHTAITYDSFDAELFAAGSPERLWADSLAERITRKIDDIHAHGLEAYYFTDLIVLPKRLVEKYREEICSADGKIDFTRPKTREIHRVMIREVFERFPGLDGLVIRFGETYLHNLPYHTGNGPVPRHLREQAKDRPYKSDGGERIHCDLMNLLREEVCVKQDKKLFYRTWDTGFFHTVPGYYLAATEGVEPHPRFYVCVKHVEGDYHRSYNFNPTLGIGRHKQVVEVQCQREYEGKGAYPNYIADGVIDGFEEMKDRNNGIFSLNQLKNTPQFAGIWTWSRGGGWVGPYITNELWCDVNTYVLAGWANHPQRPEEELFREFAVREGFEGEDIDRLHRMSLLSADAVIRGRASLVMPVNVWWTRDQFIGSDRELGATFQKILEKDAVGSMLGEKSEAVRLWRIIVALSDEITTGKPETLRYLRTSARYGLLLYSIYEQGWIVMLKGYEGDRTGIYDRERIRAAIDEYDRLWTDFRRLKEEHADCATLYLPYSFKFSLPPDYHDQEGIGKTIDRYRNL